MMREMLICELIEFTTSTYIEFITFIYIAFLVLGVFLISLIVYNLYT